GREEDGGGLLPALFGALGEERGSRGADRLIGRRASFCRQLRPGNSSKLGTSSRSWSQLARLAVKMCAVGRTSISLSRLPAGTTSSAPFKCDRGSAEPHSWQKLL